MCKDTRERGSSKLNFLVTKIGGKKVKGILNHGNGTQNKNRKQRINIHVVWKPANGL
jgi:hypothetical protein